MFQFPGFPAHDYLIHHALRDSSSRGFPHSDIRGSMLICSSPRLFAACHVLRRLPMPRHSPYALLRLNYLQQFVPASLGSRFSSQELLCSYIAVLCLAKLFSFTQMLIRFRPGRFPDRFSAMAALSRLAIPSIAAASAFVLTKNRFRLPVRSASSSASRKNLISRNFSLCFMFPLLCLSCMSHMLSFEFI